MIWVFGAMQQSGKLLISMAFELKIAEIIITARLFRQFIARYSLNWSLTSSEDFVFCVM